MAESNHSHVRRLENRVAIVTGASRGLGRAIATALAIDGARVVLVSRTQAQLEETAEAVRSHGGEALVLPLDVQDAVAAQSAVAAAVANFGRIDCLVYGAGVSVTRPALEVTASDWDHVVAVNLKAAFFWAQAVARHMVQQGSGRIIFVSSVTGEAGMPWLAPYSASKSGIVGLTRCLAAEWGSAGIGVNAIAAGFIKTGLTEAELSDERLVKRIVQRTPLGRLGRPADIAASAAFLASEEASFVSGHVLAVDGGWLAA